MRIWNFKRRVAAVLLACGAVLPGNALAAPLRTNLIVNPGFESVDTNDIGPFNSVRILDWIDSDADLDDTYAYDYSLLYSGNPAPPGSGTYHFTGGFNTVATSPVIEQTIEVSANPSGSLIAGGGARFDLRGFFSTYFEQDDFSRIRISFLDASNTEVGSAQIGGAAFRDTLPILSERRNWGNDALTGVIPTPTRTVKIEIFPETEVTNHDGYVDNLDFRVGGLTDDVALKLEVSTANGHARLRNLTNAPVDMNYYEITSISGSINPAGWNSLQDQDFEGSGGFSGTGDGWEEGGNASANGISESFLLGSSILNNTQQVALGNIFNLAGTRDLVMRYGLDNTLLLYGYVDFVPNFGVSGDFNSNGSYQCSDVDALTAEIAAGSNNAAFDLTGDGLVNRADLDAWLVEAGRAELPSGSPYLPGDANLSGSVDGSDFGVWNSNKFTNATGWCSGNFNADGAVDGSDFGIWNTNKFRSSQGAFVPEPAAWLVISVLVGLGLSRRGRPVRGDLK